MFDAFEGTLIYAIYSLALAFNTLDLFTGDADITRIHIWLGWFGNRWGLSHALIDRRISNTTELSASAEFESSRNWTSTQREPVPAFDAVSSSAPSGSMVAAGYAF
jgi:hypothetical protein